ncbi:MAG TPA: LytTR family DNA-binding domain-containing protein [Bryobacteraceae bacterium]|jgi:two-component system LytT family response regulator|nr:LytTR family DNA-binding domain-containing protein [Bryobacteraceae bacterium]
MSIRSIVVDDEELSRRVVREYAATENDIEIIAECSNGFDAVKLVAEHRPDLLFLDVQMPKLDGFEVLELIDKDVAVVFVTAYDQYATKAFDASAVDYLLKPFALERFKDAVARARQRIASHQRSNLNVAELRQAATAPGQYAQRVVVRDGTSLHVIPANQLDYAEAQDDYVALHARGKTHLKQQTISQLESSLDPARFVRVHRSFLLNLERIAKVEPYTKDTRMAVLSDGSKIPVSRSGYLRLKELIQV